MMLNRIILWLLLAFACLLPASALTVTAPENSVWEIFSIGYDAAVTEATDLGNRTETPTSNYDSAPIHRAATETKPTAAERPLFGPNAEFKAADTTATFGSATTTDYRATFFAANPELEGQVVVHHAVEQQTLKLYPSEVTEAEIHSLENLRGIPKDINSQVHLSQIRKEWNQFYLANPNATQAQLLQKASEIDAKYGSQFMPPVGGSQ